MGHLRGGTQALGVLQPAGLVAQCHVLARLRVDRGDLGQAQAQQVGFLVPLAGVAAPVGQVLRGGPPPPVRLPQRRQQLVVLGAGIPVQRGPLLGRPQQPHLVGLPVHRHDLLADLAEHADRRGPPADRGPGPALGGHRPGQQQGAVLVRFGAGVGGPRVHRVGGGTGQP